ncbi:TPA: MchS3 family protein [Raoultella ornithinolytica]
MRLSKKIVMVILFLCAHSVYSHDILSEQKRLEKINYYSVGMNGFAGKESEGEYLYRLILQKDNAEEIFMNIAKNDHSTNESKLYAACALRALGVGNINEIFNQSRDKDVVVLTDDVLRRVSFKDKLSAIIQHGCD